MGYSLENKKDIDSVFYNALIQGRKTLYEHEVYQILSLSGLDIPKYYFLGSNEIISERILTSFADEIIIKIVSPDIAHKQKLGGVKKIRNYEPLYVQYVLEKMKEEVLSHFGEDDKPFISGFLIVEYVEFKQSIGYELLVGVKEDPSFGPVVTISKGGDDAEFFAMYYDKPNLFLPKLSYDEAKKVTNSLKIKHKFNAMGHGEYLDFIARTASIVSNLSYEYSPINPKIPSYYIKTIDINPFVITKDNRFIAVDGYLEFEEANKHKELIPQINISNINAFFDPKGIGVIGVSSQPNKNSMGREIARLLSDLKRDDLYCINLKGGEVYLGDKKYKLYKSIDEISENIDMVVYAAPARNIISFFKDIKNKKIKTLVLIPGISQEMNYSNFIKELKEIVPNNIRIIGPNCMGVFYGEDENQKGVNTLFIDEERLQLNVSQFSNTALLTQSGGMAITLADKMPNAPIFKAIVSFGNKFDVKITDLIKYFNLDKKIKVIALYVEGFDYGEGRIFYEIMKDVKKPVLVYKSGRTDAGAKAAASHTAAMTGDYDVFEAACKQAKVMLFSDTDSYQDSIKAFSLLANKKVKGNRVAGVLNAGFEATVAADELDILKPAIFSKSTQDKIDQINTHGLVDTNTSILDVTPMSNDIMFKDFVEAVLKDESVDSIFIGIVPHIDNIKSTPNTCGDKDSLANLIVELYKKYDKPMVVSVNGGEYYSDFVDIIEKAGVPVYGDIRSAVKALERFTGYFLH